MKKSVANSQTLALNSEDGKDRQSKQSAARDEGQLILRSYLQRHPLVTISFRMPRCVGQIPAAMNILFFEQTEQCRLLSTFQIMTDSR